MAVTVGFLGFGNMAQAMADGFLKAGALEGGAMCACAMRWERLQSTAGARGMVPCRDSLEVAERSQVVVAAVKPYLMEEVLPPVKEALRGKVLLSVAAGWSFE